MDASAETLQWTPVAGSHEKDFSIVCTRAHESLLNINPNRHDAWRYARDIYVARPAGGGIELQFVRDFVSADTPDVFAGGNDVTCDITPL